MLRILLTWIKKVKYLRDYTRKIEGLNSLKNCSTHSHRMHRMRNKLILRLLRN